MAHINRRRFIAATGGMIALGITQWRARAQAGGIPLIFVSDERAESVRSAVDGGEMPELADLLTARAESAASKGPWSVTDDPSPAVSGDPHDYFSEGPYWWPNPDDPDAPYIRRDGEANPERFTAHGRSMGAMVGAVRDLSIGAYYLDRSAWAARACEVLNVWFVAPETRMNPHLDYGQAIRGRCDGRGIGIIDTTSLIGLVHGVTLLARAPGRDDAAIAGVQAWFSDYLTWLTTSKKGLDERNTRNNHASYWCAQVSTYAALAGRPEAALEVDERYRTVLVPGQIQPDGSCPEEEARTKSLSYSFYNADAFALICEAAYHRGVDLWSYQTDDGRGVAKVAEYLAPYVVDPSTWTRKQIKTVKPSRKLFLHLAGVRLGRDDWLDANAGLPGGQSSLGEMSLLDTR